MIGESLAPSKMCMLEILAILKRRKSPRLVLWCVAGRYLVIVETIFPSVVESMVVAVVTKQIASGRPGEMGTPFEGFNRLRSEMKCNFTRRHN